jgi:hypothetical protein
MTEGNAIGADGPAVLNMVAEGVEGLCGARNEGHRCLPTKARRSERWRNAALSLGACQ